MSCRQRLNYTFWLCTWTTGIRWKKQTYRLFLLRSLFVASNTLKQQQNKKKRREENKKKNITYNITFIHNTLQTYRKTAAIHQLHSFAITRSILIQLVSCSVYFFISCVHDVSCLFALCILCTNKMFRYWLLRHNTWFSCKKK